MAESGSHALGFRLDIKQILLEAQHRWLRPAEISEILRNYQKFHISPEPPHKPVSGSVFLFDRKVLRYFRKDGHNWRKKRDGKTVKEAHEKLKIGSVDVLHCYYAHGEENENFQRRSYWMLEQDLMHIVFVHYLEVKGNKTNVICIKNLEPVSSNSQDDNSFSLSSSGSRNKFASNNADSPSPTSTLTSAYEDAEFEDSHQASSRFHSSSELSPTEESHASKHTDGLLGPLHQHPCSDYRPVPHGSRIGESGDSFVSGSQGTLDMASWEEVFRHCATGDIAHKQEARNPPSLYGNWQYNPEDGSLHTSRTSVRETVILESAYDFSESSFPLDSGDITDAFSAGKEEVSGPRNLQKLPSDVKCSLLMTATLGSNMNSLENQNHSNLGGPLRGGALAEEGLKKIDSFSRWIAKELGEVEELPVKSTNGISWSIMESEDVSGDPCTPPPLQPDMHSLNPSLSQDQLFSILDFSPTWGYSHAETKVLITGSFLKSVEEIAECKWSCMFGEVEVPAEVLEDGVLRCHAPPYKAGIVPFYVTCSNRLACSEVREFEYRVGSNPEIDRPDLAGQFTIQIHLLRRLEKLLYLEPVCSPYNLSGNIMEKQDIFNKIFSFMEDEYQMEKVTYEKDIFIPKRMEDHLIEKQLKEKFFAWLLHKLTENGKGPNVLDAKGQGILHLAAALGYNWVLKPIVASGVSVDFRDVNGWTALHWAAFYGREETVAALLSLGAAPGALTDPSAQYPLGRTPADLASCNGHKGISGFLAESSLITHLSSLSMSDAKEDGSLKVSGVKAMQTMAEHIAIPRTQEDVPDLLLLKDSLAAVRNATQAAARIHQIFRVQSFQRKQLIAQGSGNFSFPDEDTLSIAAKTCRLKQNDGNSHAAAVRIQKKFRGWRKRKEFIMIRQRIVKIQAHVRGHQVRKKYKTIVWSVGILEKVILRWRRKGCGLRGFRSEAVATRADSQVIQPLEDDYDFLKEGRKHTEERLQKALARVKSMAQYPEARAQYHRLLTIAEDFREKEQDPSAMIMQDVKDPEADLFDVGDLLDDDTFMSIAFE